MQLVERTIKRANHMKPQAIRRLTTKQLLTAQRKKGTHTLFAKSGNEDKQPLAVRSEGVTNLLNFRFHSLLDVKFSFDFVYNVANAMSCHNEHSKGINSSIQKEHLL